MMALKVARKRWCKPRLVRYVAGMLSPTTLCRAARLLGALSLLFVALGPALGAQQTKEDPLHAWVTAKDPATLEAWVARRLAAAQGDIDRLTSLKGARTVANTLQPYDDAQNELALAGNESYLLFSLSKDASMRNSAQTQVSKIAAVATDLGLNQKVYRALVAVPMPANDPATKHYLERTLLEYRLGGVDKDDATRSKVHTLQDRITSDGLDFSKNIADDVRKITVTREQLEGLPPDFVARHKPGADGLYTLTTDAPDVGPVRNFATNADLRHRMFLAYAQRAPKNSDVLMDLLRTRQDLATTLGFRTYADLATADQMIGSAEGVRKLLQELDETSRADSEREFHSMLEFAKTKSPGITSISDADSGYWAELYRRSHFNFDAQSVRPYFPYLAVEAGILSTASQLFHVTFRKVSNAVVWDPAVTVYDVLEAGHTNAKPIGRIYLDMHPREGKDKWFSSAPVVPGIRGRQVPEGALICNFSGGVAGDPGLMLHSEVTTFFHEFGHLMHHILGGQNRWSGQGGFNVEGDFVEAPSQMLEEIFRDHKVLSGFARNYKTGEPIPADLVARMNRAGAYGRAAWVQGQLIYSTYSLQLHDRAPAEVNLAGMWKQDQERFSRATFVEGDRGYDTFTHLTGYASNYYTYALDKVIAIDFFSQFDGKDLLHGPAAMRYRRTVLEKGATEPASQLVQDFLGRPQNTRALKSWIHEEFETP
jgi:thimet oligopeptidase